jgi:hypothetical protein
MARHEDIEHDHIVLVNGGVQNGRVAVAHGIDGERVLAKPTSERIPQQLVILGQENPHLQTPPCPKRSDDRDRAGP